MTSTCVTKIWRRFLTLGSHTPSDQDVVTAFSSVGIQLCDPESVESGPGILFLDRVGDKTYDYLRELSNGGLNRVLVVVFEKGASSGCGVWKLLNAGATDVLECCDVNQIAAAAVAKFDRWAEVDRIVDSPLVKENLVGASPVWKAVLRRTVEVARFTDSSVLILGESGTGKELLARLIHTLDTRADKGELIVLDCTTVVPELSGSEFFGHERGSYTNATYARDGAFALADHGTLFLDEVGELTPRLQAELLRVVQEGAYKRVGSNSWKKTKFRLICATNRNLLCEGESDFRRDFFHRIAGWTCVLPPLRERVADIPCLVEHFMSALWPDRHMPQLAGAVRDYLISREYKGNVRELKAVVERMVRCHVGPGPLTVGDIDESARPVISDVLREWRDNRFEEAIRRAVATGVGLKEIGTAATETAIRIAIGDENGNLQRAARRLGVTDRALQMRRASKRGDPVALALRPATFGLENQGVLSVSEPDSK